MGFAWDLVGICKGITYAPCGWVLGAFKKISDDDQKI